MLYEKPHVFRLNINGMIDNAVDFNEYATRVFPSCLIQITIHDALNKNEPRKS